VLLVKEFRNVGLLFIFYFFYRVTIGRTMLCLYCITHYHIYPIHLMKLYINCILYLLNKKSKIIIYLYIYQKYTYIITNKKIT